MSKSGKKQSGEIVKTPAVQYGTILDGVVELLEAARRSSARAVNAVMTTTYWEIGRRIVEFEQGGKDRAEYGTKLLERLFQAKPGANAAFLPGMANCAKFHISDLHLPLC